MPKDDRSLWPIPAFLLIGVGIGLLTGQIAAFVIIGLGTGFLLAILDRESSLYNLLFHCCNHRVGFYWST